MAGRLSVRMPGIGAPVGALSGGNQQKVLIGRWLLAEPRVLLLYDVTRGVDVATKHELYELVMQLAGNGHAILLYSSDAEELAHLSHRVLVMREGRIAAEMAAPASPPSTSSPPPCAIRSRPERHERHDDAGRCGGPAGAIGWGRMPAWRWRGAAGGQHHHLLHDLLLAQQRFPATSS